MRKLQAASSLAFADCEGSSRMKDVYLDFGDDSSDFTLGERGFDDSDMFADLAPESLGVATTKRGKSTRGQSTRGQMLKASWTRYPPKHGSPNGCCKTSQSAARLDTGAPVVGGAAALLERSFRNGDGSENSRTDSSAPSAQTSSRLRHHNIAIEAAYHSPIADAIADETLGTQSSYKVTVRGQKLQAPSMHAADGSAPAEPFAAKFMLESVLVESTIEERSQNSSMEHLHQEPLVSPSLRCPKQPDTPSTRASKRPAFLKKFLVKP